MTYTSAPTTRSTPRAERVGIVLLALALALVPAASVQLELCACSATDHGLLCEAPPAASSCCASQVAEAPEPACPGCPALELSEADPGVLPVEAERVVQPVLVGRASLGRAMARVDRTDLGLAWRPRPPPGALRLHLLHSVIRC